MCRRNPTLFRTRCLPFADYAVILVSNGRHEDPKNPKRGKWPTGVFAQKQLKPANRKIASDYTWSRVFERTLSVYIDAAGLK
jgi:hypothetical protein